MSCTCPTCGQPLPESSMQTRIDSRLAALREGLEKAGHWISPDGRIREESLAFVLGVTVEHVQNLRYGKKPFDPKRTGGGRGRITYDLREIAEHIEKNSM